MLRKIKSYFLHVCQGLRICDKVLLAVLLPANKLFGISFKIKIYIKNEDGIFKIRTLRDFNAYTLLRDRKLRPFFKLNGREIFVDVGANVGRYSFLIANKYKDSTIIAIEPDARCVSLFKENLCLNKLENRVKIIEKIAFSTNTTKEFFLNIGHHEKNTIFETEITGADKYKGGRGIAPHKKIMVEAVSLDSVIKNVSQRVGLIKLDIQGAELDALMGATGILQKDRPNIIFEAWDEFRFQRINDFLSSFKYEIEKIDGTNYFAYCLK